MNAESRSVIDHDTQQPVEAKTTTALALVTKSIAEINAVESTVSGLEEKYRGVVFPVQTNEGMKEACKARAEIRAPRYALQNMQKAAKAPLNELKRSIDEQTEDFIARIGAIEDPIHQQIATEETRKENERRAKAEAERKRVAAIRERIDEIRQRPSDAAGQSAAEIELYITALVRLEIDDTFAEFKHEAEGAKETALVRLRSSHAKAVAFEEEQARLKAEAARLAEERKEQERLQAAERARIAEEERQAREAREAEERRAREAREAEDRRLADERARQQAELQAERERLAEQERVAAAARKAEEDRLAAERQRQKEEADRLEIQRQDAARREAETLAALEAEEKRLAQERAQLEADRTRQAEEQRMREAGDGAPVGATASESGDSNIAKTVEDPDKDSAADCTSGPEATSPQGFIDIVFDGSPSATAGRFVEVEDARGKSISIGEWVERADGYWALRVNAAELGIIPAAWMRGITSPGGPWGPPEHDVECYAGDEPPDQQPGWIALYRKIEGAEA